jgi:type I restriction enzyme S subunit
MIKEKFKETNIGFIPENWETIPLTDLIVHYVDNRGKTVPVTESGIPLIATNCIKENGLYPKYERLRYVSKETYKTWFRDHPKPNDIIIVNKGTPGLVCLVPNPVDFCIAQDMIAIRADKNKVDFKYLFAYMRTENFKYQVQNLNVGTTIPHLKKTVFSNLIIPLPPVEEQIFIGEFYYELSKKIELNQKMNQTLEEIGQAIFKHWFVHFEFPNEEGKPYKSSGGEMVDSELGEIPKGWEVKKFEDCLKLIIDHRGKTPLKLGSNWSESGFRALSAKNIKNGQIVNEDSIKFVDEELYSKWMKNEIEPEDILLTSEAPLGELVSWDYAEKIVLSQRLFGIRADKKIVYPKYLYCFMTSDLFKYELTSRATGSTVQGIRQSELLKTNVIIPTLELTREFQSIVEFKFRKIALNNEETRNLSQLRDFLLPRLISGKIRVLQGK